MIGAKGSVYNWAVVVRENGKVTVRPINGTEHEAITYKNIDNVPKAISDKVKMLMWTPIDGRSEYTELGIRIGTNLYWIM